MPKQSPDRNGQKGTMTDHDNTSLASDMLHSRAFAPRSRRNSIETSRKRDPAP